MLLQLLVVLSTLFSLFGYTADLITPVDIIDAMLSDGCAKPIAEETDKPLAVFPEQCLNVFFTDEGARALLVPKRIKNWGSNGLDGKPWQFVDEECNQFFVQLHERIAAFVPSVRLSPHDLFHGHLIGYGPHGNDHVAVVFHAKEYPSNLEMVKNRYQIPTESFSSIDDEFRNRNFLYLSDRDEKRNEIYLISERGICADYFSDLSANTLSEGIMEVVLEKGKLLGDVNMFLPSNLSRIKYQFYPMLDLLTYDLIEDYEAIESGKSGEARLMANHLIDIVISDLQQKPLLYFLTGRSFTL